MFKITVILLAMGLLAFSPSVYAHPGNTASDGCHYCRTNCARWGEVQGARHCHGGGIVAPAAVVPKKVSVPTPSLFRVSASSPNVYGNRAPAAQPAPQPAPDNDSSLGWWLVSLTAVGGGAYWYGKKDKE